ncbi:MarR family winged helix-turn-helix transcriptional regulator [Aquihabitans daechungensis]|uniref:MarR family winged helix-turn-helix transcriptional regulator n=1 Tax=Aquihabitans daechungensis TaxID=1052257 RepID=UPI003BA09E11
MTSSPLHPLLADARLTTMGLLMETHAGLRAAYEPDLEAHGLTGSAFDVLIRLARSADQRLRMTELAGQSTLSNSGFTRVVDRLLEAGLVERRRHPGDRRSFYAVLTPAGLDRVLAALPSHLAIIERTVIDVLDPDELAALERALRKVRAVVKPEADPDPVRA